MHDRPDGRTLRVTEPRAVPWLSIVFGYGPMLPFVVGAVTAWVRPGDPLGEAALLLTILWGCAILLFLSGVRRGLSFRTEGGPTLTQMATMIGLFSLGFVALALATLDAAVAALVLLLVGFGAIAVLDPIAARRGEAPLFFARLRPVQIPIALLSLAALLALRL
ncbi:hypothetical protein ASG51_08595 [Methylobacterium sp. Leaf465]|uniref:DUF3429 domain-containing protein n=1 Tax=unclassified Methylobacterium TaxID=2615210 RepID=UPI0006F6A1AA|nr:MULTISPECIES: DUF3429 domain-containing protein [unclassified Methylobacterium]KQO67763.1 hypothetical protein ASF18_04445 [Methylobacterium sp. Leaf89]KQP50659.1 hypothetical protein ASF41_14065 [Methylobacterium sp. Leaf111]KQT73534.1 hypothetical protein ASG51_08595 [Methylobacterium sp. Leaf465]KQU21078.1 hypothetical protein ASG63_05500 [Methylobacterium sp. Leaf94]